MIAKSPCAHCGTNIEFDSGEFLSGSSVNCPECGQLTEIYVAPEAISTPPPRPAAPVRKRVLKETSDPKDEARQTLILVTVFCAIAGGFIIIVGGNAQDEPAEVIGAELGGLLFSLVFSALFVLIYLKLSEIYIELKKQRETRGKE